MKITFNDIFLFCFSIQPVIFCTLLQGDGFKFQLRFLFLFLNIYMLDGIKLLYCQTIF